MYGRELDGKTYTFGHEGVLYRQSFVMYDKQTDSLWVHTTGEAIKGALKGKVLTFLPSTVTIDASSVRNNVVADGGEGGGIANGGVSTVMVQNGGRRI